MNSPLLTPADFAARSGVTYNAATVPGNPITAGIQTAFSDTANALAILRNTDANAMKDAGALIIPRYIRLKLTTVPASATAAHFAIALDNIDRFSSGGSQLGVAANTTKGNNRSDQLASVGKARIDFGAVTAAAASADRKIIAQGVLRSVIPVVNDVYLFVFGDPDEAPVSQDTGGTTAKNATFPIDPVALAPGGVNVLGKSAHSLLLHVWYPANAVTAAQYEVDFGWVELF